MPFLGTIINFLSVLIFGILGTLIKKGVPERINTAMMSATSICVIYIGVDGMLEAAPAVPEDSFFTAGLLKILIMIISMVVGVLIGEIVNFNKLITKLGDAVEKKLVSKFAPIGEASATGSFSKGFVSCSILLCVGAMSVNGAIQDGLGNPDLLLAKAIIDGISCFVLATTLGVGCAFSAFFLLFYQGAFAVLGYFLAAIIPASTITYMSVTGSLIIILVGTNVMGITNVKTANMVPAMFMPLIVEPLMKIIAF